MRVALCLTGIVGGAGGKAGKGGSADKVLEKGYEHYRKHILEKNDVDVFAHTWTVDREKDIQRLYKPKKMISEKQIMFSKDSRRDYRINNHFSRWYSTKRAVELKREYEIETGITYDCVMTTRYDIAFMRDVIFDDYDMQNFYASCWDKIIGKNGNHIRNINMYQEDAEGCTHEPMGYPYDDNGLLDLWFFGNSPNMDKFASLFDQMKEYLKPGRCPNDSAGWISNHQLSLYHLKELGLEDQIKFTMHYGLHDREDYVLIRRKFFGSKK